MRNSEIQIRIDRIKTSLEAVMLDVDLIQDLNNESATPDQFMVFHSLAAEAKYYVDRWPRTCAPLIHKLAELCPEGMEWEP